ncbi:MAG: Ig-like domain-containing protein [Deinococcus sp.]|nr:Ig-like domain-containing protein [Deinococcus sp.]
MGGHTAWPPAVLVLALATGCGLLPQGTDQTPPRVAILGLANQTTVSGVLPVTVSAVDDVGLQAVELLYDQALVASLALPPFAFTLNTTRIPHGVSINLWARATDGVGNTAQSVPLALSVHNPSSVALRLVSAFSFPAGVERVSSPEPYPLPDPQALAPPSSVTPPTSPAPPSTSLRGGTGDIFYQVQWTALNGAAAYRVYRAEHPTGPFSAVGSAVPSGQTVFEETSGTFQVGVPACYAVTGFIAGQETAFSNGDCATPLAAHQNLSPPSGAEEVGLTPTLAWARHPSALGYVYQVFDGAECSGAPMITNPYDGTGKLVLTALTQVALGSSEAPALPHPGNYAWRSVAVSFVQGVADGLSFAPCYTLGTGD